MAPVIAPDDDTADTRIAALRQRGAHRFDPIRFGYIDALARRRAAQSGELRRALDMKLDSLLASYTVQYDAALFECAATADAMARRFPDAAARLKRLQASGDVRGLRGLAARLDAESRPGPLSELVRQVQPSLPTGPEHGAPVELSGELKAIAQFRSTWTQLSLDRQLTRSLAKAPKNPGPLNSHLLVLRSLQLMRDVSPAYLQHFVSHAEALMWLDKVTLGGAAAPAPNEPARPESDRKRKPGRGKSA